MAGEHGKSNQKGNRLLRAAGAIGAWTMLSRLLGFARDILLARLLGAGAMADAFFVAFKLPNFFRRMFAEGTMGVTVTPVLARQRQAGDAAAHDYLNAIATLLAIALTLFTIAGMIGMPWLLWLFAPGFADEPDRWAESLKLARLMFPYLALISLTALAWAVLNTHERFWLPAATPALLNLAIIAAGILLAPAMDDPATALAIGVIAGGALQLAAQIPALAAIGWRPRPSFAFRQPAVLETLRLFGPALLAVAAVQINILVGTILATLLEPGAVSWLYYADRIVQLPLALFGIAMGAALLPLISRLLAAGEEQRAAREIASGLAWLSWITLPAVAGILLLAEPIIRTLFEHGAFTAADAGATARALQAYAIGLIAFCWIKPLSSGCYAHKDANAPARYAAINVGVNLALSLALMPWLAHAGLALATSLAAFINAGLLYRRLSRRHGGLLERRDLHRIGRALLASLLMAGCLAAMMAAAPFPESGKIAQAGWLAMMIGAGAGVFFLAAFALGERGLIPRANRKTQGKGGRDAS